MGATWQAEAAQQLPERHIQLLPGKVFTVHVRMHDCNGPAVMASQIFADLRDFGLSSLAFFILHCSQKSPKIVCIQIDSR